MSELVGGVREYRTPSLDHVTLEAYPPRYHTPWKEHGTTQEFTLYPREQNNKHVQKHYLPAALIVMRIAKTSWIRMKSYDEAKSEISSCVPVFLYYQEAKHSYFVEILEVPQNCVT